MTKSVRHLQALSHASLKSFLIFYCSLTATSLPVLTASAQPDLPVQTQSAKIRRIVILPFRNLTQRPEDTWLGESFSEGLISGFGQMRSLRIIERAEMQQLVAEQAFMQSALANPEQAPQLGKMVGAEYMVLGNFQKIGPQILVNARLVNVSTGVIEPGSQTQVRGEFATLFDLQAELTQKMLQRMQVQQSPGEQKQVRAQFEQTRSTFAHQVYLEAERTLENEFVTDKLFQALYQRIDKAIQADPNYLQLRLAQARLILKQAETPELYPSFEKSDVSKAAQQIEALLDAPGLEAEAYLALSKLRALQERPQEALEAAQKAVKIKPQGLYALNYLTQKYDLHELFFREDALPLLENDLKSVGADINDPIVLRIIGYSYFPKIMANPKGDHSAFEQRLIAAFERYQMPTLSLQLAMFYLMQQNMQKYQKYIDATLSIDENNLFIMFVVSLSVQYVEPQRALKLTEKMLEIQPEFDIAYLLQSTLYQRQFKQADKAEAILLNLTQKHPQDAKYIYHLGQFYLQEKRYQEALKTLNQALEVKNITGQWRYAIYQSRAKTHHALKQYPSALKDYAWILKAEQFNLKMDATYKERASMYFEMQNYALALEDMKQYLQNSLLRNREDEQFYKLCYLHVQAQQNPKDVNILNDLGTAYLNQQEYARAQRYFEQGLAREKNNAVLNFNLALVKQAQKDYPAATALLDRALQHKPDYVKAWSAQAKNEMFMGQLKQAEQSAQRALSLQANFLEAWVVLAEVYTQQHKTLQAQKAWEAVLEIDAKHPQALKALGKKAPEDYDVKLKAETY